MSIKDIKERARYDLKGHYTSMAIITLLIALINIGVALIPYVGIFISLIIYSPLILGYVKCINKIYYGEEVKVSYLFYGFSYFKEAFVFALLSYIYIGLWSLLLIVPGIIKTLEYDFGYYLIADDECDDGRDAINDSKFIMEGHRFDLFRLQLSFLGWFILGLLTCGILLLWVYPYYTMAKREFYNEITL